MYTIEEVVGNNLKYLRYKANMSQEKFYEQYKLNYKYFASIERGEVNMTIGSLDNLAKLLKVDIREFFNPDETRWITKKRIDEKEKEDL